MRLTSRTTLCCAAALLSFAAPNRAQAQRDSSGTKGVLTVTPGAQYKSGGLARLFLGSGWRDVWVTPVQAPVLDIETYAGGLKLKKRGGGFHSLVLHLDEENGWKEYRFRSVDKFPMQGMPPAVQGTAVGRIFEDQVSVFFPGAPVMVHPLLEAVGLLHVKPELYVMGDSPRLKEQRDSTKGMLGTFELKGEEAPDDKPGFGGATKIKETDGFFEDLAESRENRLDEREFLAARLVDILVNDPDRSPDNYDWARFGEKGAYTWRPLPRDRDQAFINARGLLNTFVMRAFYPKQVAFTSRVPLKGLTYSSHVLDRRLLQRLTAEDFRDVALRVQQSITDPVIESVVAELPREWREKTTADEEIVSVLRARRNVLPEVAMAFYRRLSREVDVRGTDAPDRIIVDRLPDGRVTVVVTDPAPSAAAIAERRADGARVVTTSDGDIAGIAERGPYFSRTFIPGETREVRIYANDGDDVAIVRGAASGAIKVRIIGGKGNDALTDSAGGHTVLYDAEGANELVATRNTRVDTRPWKELAPDTGFRKGGDWSPDFGRSRAWRPVIDYNTASGLILGVGPRVRDYGFRRLPYHWQAESKLLYGTSNGGLGVTFDADYRKENSPRGFRVEALATQLEATRFFGYGNNTAPTSRALSVVHQNMVSLEPSAVWHIGFRSREGFGNPIRGEDTLPARLRPTVGEFRVGPSFTWIDPDPGIGSPLLVSNVRGTEAFGVGGAVVGLELDRTDDDAVPTAGYTLDAELGAYPLFGNAFGTASARGSLYVPLKRIGSGPHLAFRAGASMATGEYPAQFAAAVGGRNTVRGYSWHRFAGDVATSGSAELRVPVGTVNILLKSQLGVFGLADAGRVWFDGRSDGGWHTGVGGGFWLAALGRSVSVAYAKGETPRWYISSGLFY
jgi:hypothetical protein